MTSGDWRRINELYHAGLERDESERSSFLEEACAGDEDLRHEVESLIAASENVGDFLALPAIELAARDVAHASSEALALIGKKLGQYEVQALVGLGGMGEVYRARDVKLGREVAVKVLPRVFSQDSRRLARFEREARLLASLNHPSIATLYGSDEFEGTHYLVMELVEGETLAQRIAKSPLSVAEALTLFKQIAEAVEAAHKKGIVHRDLKPANIKITPDGKAKVLDFGVAKAFGADLAGPGPLESPTVTREGTAAGVILGTVAYMSPEQARGTPADRRCDIWAFGCVLFEALSGRAAFAGATVPDTLVRILEHEPEWSALPKTTPAGILGLLHRCLNKDPLHRLQHIGDARIEIEDALTKPSATAVETEPTSTAYRSRLAALVVIAFSLALVAGLALWSAGTNSSPELARPVTRFMLNELASSSFRIRLAISPDGTRLVYVGDDSGTRQLFLREMDTGLTAPIAGTEGAAHPFFSPDGEWVGYFDYAMAKMRKVSLRGGAPASFADSGSLRGASWGEDDAIIYAPSFSTGLWRVSANGNSLERLTELNAQKLEQSHRWPAILPGGKAVLFTVTDRKMSTFDEARIEVLHLETGERRVVLERGRHPLYVATGHLLYTQAGSIFAAPFDLDRLELVGPSTKVVQGIPLLGDAPSFAVSQRGTLVYSTGEASNMESRLVWVDRAGNESPLSVGPEDFTTLRISPDGRYVAMQISRVFEQLWIHDLSRGTTTRVSREWEAMQPIWSPDGSRVIFSRGHRGKGGLFSHRADGSGEIERLVESEFQLMPVSFSADGHTLAYLELHADTNQDIWMLPMEGEREPRPFLRTPAFEGSAEFSPNGKWLAYVSDETGTLEVYLTSYRDGGKWQISTRGGSSPLWSTTGDELFYREGNRMMAVPMDAAPALSPGNPVVLFEKANWSGPMPDSTSDGLAADGRFLLRLEDEQEPAQIHVVLNWFEELKRLAPTN